jgi:hypothetical protein
MEKETTQANEGLEAVIADMKEQVKNLTKDEMQNASWEIEYGVLLTGNEALKLIEFYNKHKKNEANKRASVQQIWWIVRLLRNAIRARLAN